MKRYTAFGRWFRAWRIRHGFRSGRALSAAAGLSTTYISDIEAGKARPKSSTVLSLASALGLSPTERSELQRRAKLAGEPPSIEAALSAPLVPGLATWRYLPELLHAAPRPPLRLSAVDVEDVYAVAVRAAASLLAWLAIPRAVPKGKARRRFAERLEAAAQDRSEAQVGFYLSPDGERFGRSLGALADAWKEHLFSEKSSAIKAFRPLRSWSHDILPAVFDASGAIVLTFELMPDDLHARWGVSALEMQPVVAVHDALTTFALWSALDLAAAYGGDPGSAPDCLHRIAGALHLAAVSPETLRADLLAYRSPGMTPAERSALAVPFLRTLRRTERWIAACRLAARLYEIPGLARCAFRSTLDSPAPESADDLLRHCGALSAVVDDVRQLASPAPAPPPDPVPRCAPPPDPTS
jgi:transcriptional regulator with XRE-family HTH domain